VRSEQVVRPPFPTLTSLDEEFGGAHMEAASELSDQPDRRRRRYVWLLILIVVSAVAIAVIWPNNALQLWSSAQLLIEQTTSGSTSGSPGSLIALSALKDEISELRYELRCRSGSGWNLKAA
jgi:hypothetical protein